MAGRGSLDRRRGTRVRTDEILQRVARATATTGAAFFESLVTEIAAALGTDYAFVGELVRPGRVRSVAAAGPAGLLDDFEYDLAGTPCSDVTDQQTCYYPQGVVARFPDDPLLAELGADSYLGSPLRARSGEVLGLLVVLHRRPIDTAVRPELVLEVFAGHAAAELERRRLDAQEERSRALMESILGSRLLAVCVLDPDGNMLYANDRTAEILALTRAELLRTNAFDPRWETCDLAGRPLGREELPVSRVLAAGEPVFGVEVRISVGVGTRPVRVNAAPLEEGGRTTAVLLTLEDISERLRAEREVSLLQEQLVQSQKLEAIGRLAGGVAHDFNNVLTAITVSAELARQTLDGRHPAYELIADVQEASDRAAGLTRQLLAFASRQPTHPEVLDVGARVHETLKLVRRLVGEQIQVAVDAPAEPVYALLDPGQLEQVLVNLAVNACDAMPGGGRLSFAVATRWIEGPQPDLAPGEHVEVTVSDTGQGMPDDVRRRALEPFFTTKGRAEGTGLGLSTCHGIVKQHGGAIAIESAEGEGTAVRLSFPAVAGPVESRPVEAGAAAPREAESETILLVEDEAAVLKVGRRALEAVGYRVLPAATAAEARRVARAEGGIDLLLTDVVLPDGDGRDLARELVTARPELRVLYTSGYADGGRTEDLSPFLRKPYTPEELGAKAREALSAERPVEAKEPRP